MNVGVERNAGSSQSGRRHALAVRSVSSVGPRTSPTNTSRVRVSSVGPAATRARRMRCPVSTRKWLNGLERCRAAVDRCGSRDRRRARLPATHPVPGAYRDDLFPLSWGSIYRTRRYRRLATSNRFVAFNTRVTISDRTTARSADPNRDTSRSIRGSVLTVLPSS